MALKLLRRGLDTDDVLERFLAERQILAALPHRNLARLLDGGTSDDGRPYLVLEYVEGEPITDYCDRRRLAVEDRLRVFREACNAVGHLHRNLVLHRDLKPSNILVATNGQVKLLDLGIAKILDPDALPTDSRSTRTGLRLMTPEYASPEQIMGRPVTTASDVYQLGCVLYRLLVGRPPHRAEAARRAAVERAIMERETTPPSRIAIQPGGDESPQGDGNEDPSTRLAALRASTPGQLRRRLEGDLDTIVQTTLRKEPERRYSSVEALAADIDRHLAHHPITARPDRWTYRTAKFVRRNRALVGWPAWRGPLPGEGCLGAGEGRDPTPHPAP